MVRPADPETVVRGRTPYGGAAGRYTLELGGLQAGWMLSVSGGDAEGIVASEPGPDGVVRKHIEGLRYTDIELTVGAGLSKPLSDWLAAVIASKHVPKSGAVHIFDFNMAEVEKLEFVDAFVREITFPALDAAAKEPAKVAIKLAPARTKRVKGTGVQAAPTSPHPGRLAVASNFRLSIDGIDCKRVAAIGPITIRQKIVETRVGGHFDLQPAGLEIGELLVTAAGDSSDFVQWHQDFVVKGNASAEKKGLLELLAQDLKTVLLTLPLAGLGIFRLERENAGAERPSRLQAWIYCEEVGLVAADPSAQ